MRGVCVAYAKHMHIFSYNKYIACIYRIYSGYAKYMLILYITSFIFLGIYLAYAKHILVLYTTSFISLSIHLVYIPLIYYIYLLKSHLNTTIYSYR